VFLAILVLLGLTIGLKPALLVHLPALLVAASVGVWLFHVQRRFEDTYEHQHAGWSYFDAGLQGSSHLVLPKPFQWITASIGIQHLSVRISNYRLQRRLD
jgi:omega-6 fatty acid desaturase (delta-12 desaturase)